MFKRFSFLTGSRYNGTYNDATHSMDGFGVYYYPDGSEYRGYFRNGKFHGFGSLKLASPSKFIFKGLFENGVLKEIEDMQYADGLRLKGTFDGNKLNVDKWTYCTKADRRYSTEMIIGINPVGPEAFLTRTRPPRNLVDETYDTEEGFFQPKSGFLFDRPPPLPPTRFVNCPEEVEWIKSHCRRSPAIPHVITPEFCREIIQTNYDSMIETGDTFGECFCGIELGDKRLYRKVLKKLKAKEKKRRRPLEEPKCPDVSEGSSDIYYTPSATSCASFSDALLVDDIFGKTDQEVEKLEYHTKYMKKERRTSPLVVYRDSLLIRHS